VRPASRLSVCPPDGRKPIVFCWGVSSFFGWGLYGLNLALALSRHPVFAPFAAMRFGPGDCVLDPLREHRMASVAIGSSALWDALPCLPDETIEIDAPVLQGLGAELNDHPAEGGKRLTGQPTVGVVFLERAALSPAALERAERFALIVAGSTWNEHVLRANGIVATTTVLQGVDTSVFHPGPRSGQFPGRFVIFSGGKLEHRKGQDLVVKAFRAFRARHPEALLVTAWHTPWHWADPDMARLTGTVAAEPDATGHADTAAWAIANGVPADSLVALGAVPNIAMAHVLREADVGLFPNRCEGGTNLVAMECMACGVPVILSANTGHLDLLRDGNAFALERQGTVADRDGWGESDVEEIIDTLETVWTDRHRAAETAERGAGFIAPMTWERQTERLLRAIDPLLP
jgi:glycosyltransferase involved in cell wall biosynthesis